jgi:hypothetical protein
VDGRFLFRDVPSGQYLLTVVREGIKLQVPVSIVGNQPARGLTLEVKSEPAITGTVFHPTGERAAATRVQAYRTVHTPLGPRMQSVMSVATDDLGEFRLFRLRHGEYHLSAGYSDRERRVVTQGLRLTPNLSKPDEGFPTIFYSDEYTLFQSHKVRLNRDTDSTGIQIFLKDGPRYSLNVTLVPEGSCARVAVVAEGAYVTNADFANNVCGSTRLTGLSEGTYLLLATNDLLASDVVRATTVNSSTEVKVVLQPTVSISGRMTGNAVAGRGGPRGFPGAPVAPGGRGLPPGTPVISNVRLSRNSSEISQDLDVPIAADGAFIFPAVGPGSYDVSIQPLPDRAYVRSVAYGLLDALFTPITVNGATPVNRLTIDLAQSNATAEGIVVDRGGRPVPGAEVVLVPRGNRRRADRFLITTADAGGNFRLAGIPAMDYAVLAFEDIEPQAYFVFVYDNGAFNRYTVTAQTLSSGASNNQLRLVAIPAEETAGGIR